MGFRISVAVVVGFAGLVVVSTQSSAQTPAPPAFITQSADQRPRALEPTVLRERRVNLDLSLLGSLGAAPAERLTLELFPDVSYTAVLDRFERTASGVIWSGSLAGLPLSTAVFAAVDGALAGHLTSPLGEFVLENDGAGGYVIQ